MNNRKEKDQDKDKPNPGGPPGAAKVKCVEAQDSSPNSKGPKTPKANPTVPKAASGAETSVAAKPPCNFYTSANGCKKGQECGFVHDWNAIPVSGRQQRCKNCGAKGHRVADCKAGSKGMVLLKEPTERAREGCWEFQGKCVWGSSSTTTAVGIT